MQNLLPNFDTMYDALVSRDSAYEGVFVVGVRTTGIFCRPTCPARKPKATNVEFFAGAREALGSGYRPCKRCRPLEPSGDVPEWLRPLLAEIDGDPDRRWTDDDLRALGVHPHRVRRWFQEHHGMTFHAFSRARRMGRALSAIREGGDATGAGFTAGFESVSGFRDAFARTFDITPTRAAASAELFFSRVLTPLGPMVAAATDSGVCLLEFADRRMLPQQMRTLARHFGTRVVPGSNDRLEELQIQLNEYFAGKRRDFSVALDVPGSDFQKKVWHGLLAIPYGETRSYEQLATHLGHPQARRAVGRANGENRIAIVIPCHRVIGADGKLRGYGGGLWRKQRLLDLEVSGA